MNAKHTSEAEKVSLWKQWSFTCDEAVNASGGRAKICCGSVGHNFIVRSIANRRARFDVGIHNRSLFAVATEDVFQFVSKHKPKVIHTVVPHGQSNHWRRIVKPEANAINLCALESFDHEEPDSRILQNSRNLPRSFWRSEKRSELRYHFILAVRAESASDQHVARNVLNPIKPSELTQRKRLILVGFLRGERQCYNVFDVGLPEEAHQITINAFDVLRVVNREPSTGNHLRHRQVAMNLHARGAFRIRLRCVPCPRQIVSLLQPKELLCPNPEYFLKRYCQFSRNGLFVPRDFA